jgi:hypothetical protein
MLRTVFLGFLASFLPFLLAYLGIHVGLHPPQDEKTRKLRKLQFWGLSSLCAAASLTQIVSNSYDQKHTQNLLDNSLSHVDMKVENLASNCRSAAQAKEWGQECINRIQNLASVWSQLMPKRSSNANNPASRPPANTEIAKNNSDVTPAIESFLHSLPNNVMVYFSDSPRCFDKYSMPAYEGCTFSDCEQPCITLSPNAKTLRLQG